MALTTTQAQTLKAAIDANPTWAAFPNTSDGAFGLAILLNEEATPAYVVWRTSLGLSEITQNGFTWVEVDNLTVGKARIWEWMFDNETRSINPSKVNIRDGIIEVWRGTAAKLAVQAVVFSHCKRNASEVEKILATGLGSDADPAVMSFEGTVSYADVQAARNI